MRRYAVAGHRRDGQAIVNSEKHAMSDEPQLPEAWIEFGATLIYDLHRAGILYDIDDMTDAEIDKALEKVRKPQV